MLQVTSGRIDQLLQVKVCPPNSQAAPELLLVVVQTGLETSVGAARSELKLLAAAAHTPKDEEKKRFPQNENARGERAFSVVFGQLGGSWVFHYPRGCFGGLVKGRVNSQNP
jgi:hypothetical protein